VGQTASPIVFAFLADATGYGSSFVFTAAAAAVTAALLITLVPETGNLAPAIHGSRDHSFRARPEV